MLIVQKVYFHDYSRSGHQLPSTANTCQLKSPGTVRSPKNKVSCNMGPQTPSFGEKSAFGSLALQLARNLSCRPEWHARSASSALCRTPPVTRTECPSFAGALKLPGKKWMWTMKRNHQLRGSPMLRQTQTNGPEFLSPFILTEWSCGC